MRDTLFPYLRFPRFSIAASRNPRTGELMWALCEDGKPGHNAYYGFDAAMNALKTCEDIVKAGNAAILRNHISFLGL